MNVLKYRVSLDMFDTLSQITIKAKKGDSACQIHITLTEKGKIYHIGEGCYATFNAKKSDGNFIFDKCTIEDNSIVYDFSSSIDEDGNAQISACEGIVECEVTLYNAESHQLTSPRFTLFIDGTVYNGEEIISTPQANVLKELINEANSLIDEVETKLEAVDEALEPYEYLKKDDNGYTNIDLLSSKHLEVAENYVAVLPTADRFLSEVPAFLNKGVNISGETFVETEPTTEYSIATKGYVDRLVDNIETALDNFEVDQTYNPESENAQSGMAIAEAVAPKADKSYLDNNFANAIRNTKSGASITMNDVSPVEHNLDIKLTSTATNSSTSGVFVLSNTEEIEYDYPNAIVTIDTSDGVAVANETLSEMFGIGSMGGLCLGDTLTLNYTSQNGSIRIYGDNIENHNEGSKKSISFVANKETLNKKVEFLCDDSATFSNMELDRISYFITDFSNIKVTRYGKNFFDYNRWVNEINSSKSNYSGTCTHLGEECFWYIAARTSTDFKFMQGEFLENTQYTFTLECTYTHPDTTSYKMPMFKIYYTDGTSEMVERQINMGEFIRYSHTTKLNKTIAYIQMPNMSNVITLYVKTDIQLEIGTTATDYEPYIEPQTVNANADGTVEGIQSLYPTTTLITDTEGAIIDVSYNADTKKYIDNKFAELSQALLNL